MTARGPAFKKGYISPSFDNIQLYYLEAGKIMCSNYSLLHVVRVILDQPGYTKILYLHCLQVSDVREHVNRVSLTS